MSNKELIAYLSRKDATDIEKQCLKEIELLQNKVQLLTNKITHIKRLMNILYDKKAR